MLGVNQLDFINYTTAFKGNYRKGVHKMRAILTNPTHAAEFAANLGGVSVVLGVPIGYDDKNSATLLSLLLGSSVADTAVYTWLGQYYEFSDWDNLLSDATTCGKIVDDPLQWRAMSSSSVGVGKIVATLAGLSCSAYADMTAVAASSVAMAAVAASSVAMTAVAASSVAMAAVIASSTALNAVVSSSVAMTAVAASPVAMAALWKSDTAIQVLKNNSTAWATFTGANSTVMGKTVAILAGLDPAAYADMTAVAASSVAMTAVAASSVAMTAIAASSTGRTAVEASSTAIAAINARTQTTVEYASGTVAASGTFRSGYAWVCQAHSGYNSAGSAIVTTTITGLLSGNITVNSQSYTNINRFANNPGWSGPGAYFSSEANNRPAAKLVVW